MSLSSGQGPGGAAAQDYDVSLDSKFRHALRLLAQLESGELLPRSDEFRALHIECLRALVECAERVQQLGLFSPNETWDDILTPDLRYLNLNFYIAKVLEKTPINPARMQVQSRVDVLNLAVHRYLQFVSDVNDLKLMLRPASGPPMPLASFVSVDLLLPEGKFGEFDLARFNSRKNGRRVRLDISTRLGMAEKRLRTSKANAPPNDEERLRELESDRLVLHWFSTWDALLGVTAELDLLAASALAFDVPERSRNRSKAFVPVTMLPDIVAQCGTGAGATFEDLRLKMVASAGEDMSRKVESAEHGDGRLLGENGRVRRPFVIMPKGELNRTKLAQSVFGTGQRMPTVTVEELVERELANQAKPEVSQSELDKALEEDTDEAADILTMKARRWDDFTEANARGSGNTLNLG